MISTPIIDSGITPTTDGEIALINLDSARRRSWSRFYADPLLDGIAETVVENEQLTVQFVGDVSALDRLESLAEHLARMDSGSARTALIQAQVASMLHRFTDAGRYLAQADLAGAPPDHVGHLRLTINQACGVDLDGALRARREIARKSGRLEDLVALGALLADLHEFADADGIYKQALRDYRDVSPFPVAWISFQLGVLWGELVPETDTTGAAQWYQRAIERLPGYAKARVHLAEIYLSSGRSRDAEQLLAPAGSSGDPEVPWRLADALAAQGKVAEAQAQMEAARSAFESLLARHALAFADHGAEFFAGSGNDPIRALDLARVNVANRPTLRAFEQAHEIAVRIGDADVAIELSEGAARHWGDTIAFLSSSLSEHRLELREGAPA